MGAVMETEPMELYEPYEPYMAAMCREMLGVGRSCSYKTSELWILLLIITNWKSVGEGGHGRLISPKGRVCLPLVFGGVSGGACCGCWGCVRKGGESQQEVQGWAEQRSEEFRRVDLDLLVSLKDGGNCVPGIPRGWENKAREAVTEMESPGRKEGGV